MTTSKTLRVVVVVAVSAFLLSSCDSGRADQVVKAADEEHDRATSLYLKTESRTKELLSAKGNSVEELKANKAKVIDQARSIADDYQKVSDMLKDVAKQYREVSQMNLNAEHVEFAKAKADEFDKRSEAVAAVRDGVQAFIDTDDFNALHTKLAACEEKQHQLFKEAEDLASKANMIRHKSDPLITW